MKSSKGHFSRKTRNMARHHKPSELRVRDIIKTFAIGDKVAVVPKGNGRNVPHPRYKGRIGRVIEKRGSAYMVEVSIMGAKRKLIVPAVHLDGISS